MKFLEKFSTWPFIVYCIALGIFLLVAVNTDFLSYSSKLIQFM